MAIRIGPFSQTSDDSIDARDRVQTLTWKFNQAFHVYHSRAAFMKEDWSNQIQFESPPRVGSSNDESTDDYRRNAWTGTDADGHVVFHFTRDQWRVWRFIWTSVSQSFMQNLQTVNRWRRFLFRPDTSLPNEFRVKSRITRLPVTEDAAGRYSTEIEIEEW